MFRSTLLIALLAAGTVLGCSSRLPARMVATGLTCDAAWSDPARDGRVVPVRIRMPEGGGKAPLILFSHGLGGNLDAGTQWVEAWRGAGFLTVNLQHPGSDEGIWRGKARPMQGVRKAMSVEQMKARAEDVRFVLDHIARGGMEGACDLSRADMNRVGMSGHSFGAQTTLAVSGTRYDGAALLADPRIRASIAFSPQPAQNQDDRAAFGAIHIPFMSITGTRDALPWLNKVTAADRIRPYAAMPAGAKYLLVFDGGTHMMFGGQQTRMRRATPPPGLVDNVTAATTLFWRATLMDDARARAELDAFGSRMGKADRFEAK